MLVYNLIVRPFDPINLLLGVRKRISSKQDFLNNRDTLIFEYDKNKYL